MNKAFGENNEGVCEMLSREEDYWRGRENGVISKDYVHKNLRIAILSADNPHGGRAIGGKHVHIHLLQKALDSLGTVNYLLAYDHISSVSVNITQLKDWLGCSIPNKELLKNVDLNFACLVFTIEKQLEGKLETLLRDKYLCCISAQDVIGAIAAANVLEKLKLNIPIVTTLHGYFTNESVDYGGLSKKGLIHDFFIEYEKRAYLQSSYIITVDTRIGEYVKNITEDEKTVEVMYNAVDDTVFTPCYRSNEMIKNVLLVPRRLVPKNGVIYSLMAAKRLVEKGKNDFMLLIAGDGIERERILEYIKVNNLEENVTYLGAVPHNQMLQYFRAAKGVVIPSVESNGVEEATSIAVLEAMACGRVPVVYSTGGLKEIIRDGENGFVVKPEDVEALADAMDRLISMDEETWREIGTCARQDVEQKYGYIAHARQFISILQSVVRDG